jgi:uncharacterized membrane protein
MEWLQHIWQQLNPCQPCLDDISIIVSGYYSIVLTPVITVATCSLSVVEFETYIRNQAYRIGAGLGEPA